MMTLGNRTELMVDDALFEEYADVEFAVVHPERRERVLLFDMPWEGVCCTYQTVFKDPRTGLVMMYYRGGAATDCVDQNVCLAVSRDGVHFERVDIDGTNMILRDIPACHNFAPFYDENPACTPDRQYKALGMRKGDAGHDTLMAFYSADGIEWHSYGDFDVMTDGLFDSLNTVFWDKNIGKYRCYSRYWSDGFYKGYRAIQSSVSDDFINWSAPVYNTYNGGGGPTQHFYTNSVRQVPGAEDMYVSFPMRFSPERVKVPEHGKPGVSDCMFMSSRDGTDWKVDLKKPWIYPGIDPRQWTQRNFIVSAGIIDMNDEFSVYISDHYCWDDNSMVRYSVPRMRFGSVYGENGRLMTKPFVLEGDRLTFNYNTSAMGTLRVEILDAAGKPLDGYSYEIYGNELEYAVDVSTLRGETLRLRIGLQDAFLYAIGC